MAVNSMATIDVLILLVVAWFALSGARRGFVLSVFDIVALALTIILATKGFHFAGALIATQFGWSIAVADVFGFVALLIIGELAHQVGAAMIAGVLRPVFTFMPPINYVNKIAGVIPGAIRGVGYVAVVLIAIQSLPLSSSLASMVSAAPVAGMISHLVGGMTPSFDSAVGVLIDGRTPNLPDPTLGLTDHLPIPQGINATASPAAEAELVQMTNLARAQAGVPPLLVDKQMTQVALAHSLEMFHLAYFSHDSPTNGTPLDRFHAAGITFIDIGENVAYAPSISLAFRGLMNSPGHRANILSPQFHRIGVGVAEAGIWGYMVTQDFAN